VLVSTEQIISDKACNKTYNVCNEIKHSKYSDLHQHMIEAVWEAADKVLRTHTKKVG